MLFTITIQTEANSLTEALSLLGGPGAAITANSALGQASLADDLASIGATPEPAIEPSAEQTAAKSYEITDVRSALATLRKAKNAAAAKEILTKHGVSSVGDLPEDAYAAVVAEAEEAMQ